MRITTTIAQFLPVLGVLPQLKKGHCFSQEEYLAPYRAGKRDQLESKWNKPSTKLEKRLLLLADSKVPLLMLFLLLLLKMMMPHFRM